MMNYLQYMCHGTHEPVMWSSVRSDQLAENCAKCGTLVKPHVISEIVDDNATLIPQAPAS
jgi:NAD-dependent SIR2 family protein deacetylase